MIRICYMIDAPYAGGAERYIEMLATSLDRNRFDVSVVMRDAPGTAPLAKRLASRGIRVERLHMNLPFEPGGVLGVAGVVSSIAPHIVHVNVPGPYDGQMGLLLPISRACGAWRAVVTEHLPMVEKLWKRAIVKGFSYRWLDAAFTVCRANVEYLVEKQKVPRGKIRLVYNGLPGDFGIRTAHRRTDVRASLGLDRDTVALSIVGSLIERKGHELLFRALSGLPRGGWRLFVVGNGELEGKCRWLLEELDLDGRVEMLGSRRPEEVEEILAGMDALILPSYVEGFPYVVLEAMASSLPVVASDVFGVAEAAGRGETAILFPPGDEEALRRALAVLLEDAELRSALGRAGRRRFEENFTLERHVSAMERHYMDILGMEPEREVQ